MTPTERQALTDIRHRLSHAANHPKDPMWHTTVLIAIGELTALLDVPEDASPRLTPTFCPTCHAVEKWHWTLESYPGILVLKCPNGHQREVPMTREESDALTTWEQAQYTGLEVISE